MMILNTKEQYIRRKEISLLSPFLFLFNITTLSWQELYQSKLCAPHELKLIQIVTLITKLGCVLSQNRGFVHLAI